METYLCYFCQFTATSMNGILKHVGCVHSHEANFHVVCGINNCPRTYKNYHSFRKHLLRQHPDHMKTVNLTPPDNIPVNPSHTEMTPMEVNTMIDLSDVNSFQPEVQPVLPTNSHLSAALFIIKTKEVLTISQTSTDQIINDVTEIVANTVASIEARVTDTLSANNVSLEDVQGLKDIFNDESLRNPFWNLQTEYKQHKYYQEHLGLVTVEEKVLGTMYKRKHTSSCRPVFQSIQECSYTVPLLQSLQQFISNDFIFNEIVQGHTRSDGIIEDFCDAEAYQCHPLFSTSQYSLQIQFYYDDAEVVNPIGSRTKVHKLALFYYTLGNVSPKYRSSLNFIQLVAVVKHEYVLKYGFAAVLHPFIEDIKSLESENGVNFQNNGHIINCRGTISILSADNLGSWSIGGYKMLSSATFKCRFCLATVEDIQLKFDSNDFQPRTRATHEDHCEQLDNNEAANYGLHCDSFLNSLQYFHVVDGLSPDVMHDVLEGALEYEVKELLKYIISQKYISLNEINSKIESFPYGYADAKNKPSLLSDSTMKSCDHSLRQNASQMWCLARLLPLMIGHLIPENNIYWNNFTLMLKIIDYIFAPVTSPDIATYVKTLISEHHESFRELYPSALIIPKMHYMIHLPEWMIRFGPPSRYWCMRFEAKHSYFKRLTHVVKNFKNIAKTVAERHQTRMCYELYSGNIAKPASYGKVRYCSLLPQHQHGILIQSKISRVSDLTKLYSVTWADIGGSLYKVKAVIILQSGLMPTFGVIEEILLLGVDVCAFIVSVYETENFNSHYHSYEVSPTGLFTAVTQKDLIDHHVLHLYRNSETLSLILYIPLKYHIMENI